MVSITFGIKSFISLLLHVFIAFCVVSLAASLISRFVSHIAFETTGITLYSVFENGITDLSENNPSNSNANSLVCQLVFAIP